MQKPLMFGEHEVANIISSRMLELSAEQLQALEWAVEFTLETIFDNDGAIPESESDEILDSEEIFDRIGVLQKLRPQISDF